MVIRSVKMMSNSKRRIALSDEVLMPKGDCFVSRLYRFICSFVLTARFYTKKLHFGRCEIVCIYSGSYFDVPVELISPLCIEFKPPLLWNSLVIVTVLPKYTQIIPNCTAVLCAFRKREYSIFEFLLWVLLPWGKAFSLYKTYFSLSSESLKKHHTKPYD